MQCVQQLGEEEVRRLLDAEKYAEICDSARRVESATNLLASFEKIKFNDALKNPQHQQRFAVSLSDMLYGPEDETKRFARFTQVLEEMVIAK